MYLRLGRWGCLCVCVHMEWDQGPDLFLFQKEIQMFRVREGSIFPLPASGSPAGACHTGQTEGRLGRAVQAGPVCYLCTQEGQENSKDWLGSGSCHIRTNSTEFVQRWPDKEKGFWVSRGVSHSTVGEPGEHSPLCGHLTIPAAQHFRMRFRISVSVFKNNNSQRLDGQFLKIQIKCNSLITDCY